MQRLAEIRVFLPNGLGEGPLLYGLKKYRAGIGDLTIVVLGETQEKHLQEVDFARISSSLEWTPEEGTDDVSLDWVGSLGGSGVGRPSRATVWMEMRKEGEVSCVHSIHADNGVDISVPIKVFCYEPAKPGRNHYQSVNSSSAGINGTGFEFAVCAIHKRPLIEKRIHDPGYKPPLIRTSVFSCFCFSEAVSASTPSWFETGRLIHRWRESAFLDRCTKNRMEDVDHVNARVLWMHHALLARIIQLILGVLLVSYCIHHRDDLFAMLQESATFHLNFLKEQTIWLSGTPAGLKLHRPLAEFYAACLRQAGSWTYNFHMAVIQNLDWAWTPTWVCSALFGIAIQLALCIDVLYFFHLPLSLCYTGFSLWAFLHLKCLILTWQLLRGRFAREKRRRKRRSESTNNSVHMHFGRDKKAKDDEVLMEHLIVGVLLFTPLLALMPTTLLFFSFLLCLHLTSLLFRAFLAVCMNFFVCNPLVLLLIRISCPSLFPGALKISVLRERTGLITSSDGVMQEIPCWYYNMASEWADLHSCLQQRCWQCVERLWQIQHISISGVPFAQLLGLRP